MKGRGESEIERLLKEIGLDGNEENGAQWDMDPDRVLPLDSYDEEGPVRGRIPWSDDEGCEDEGAGWHSPFGLDDEEHF